jgi:hypothetical protein
MSTVQQVIDFWQEEHYPRCSDTRALRVLNRIHRRILSRVQVRNSSTDISLTSGTRQYDLAATVMKVWAGYYIKSATADDFYPLIETSVDELDQRDSGWRSRTNTSSSTPDLYYVTSAVTGDGAKNQVGFVEIPPTTTSGGYPKVTLHTTDCAELATDDSVPTNLLDDEIYLAGMSYLWARQYDKENAGSHEAWFESEIDKNILHVKNMLERDNTEIVPAMFSSVLGVV